MSTVKKQSRSLMPARRSRLRGMLTRRPGGMLREIAGLTTHTVAISRGLVPLGKLLSHDRAVEPEEFTTAIDAAFAPLYEHPVNNTLERLTWFLRERRMIPNEQSTENLIRFLVDQAIARSPVDIPDMLISEFWAFFEELFSSAEVKGLGDMSLDMIRLVLHTYEPLLLEVVNLLKAGKRFNEWQLRELARRANIVRNDVVIIQRQIKALRYIRPFFQTDPQDFNGQAQIAARMVREFGPFFVKMAQVAAANADFLPKEIAAELAVFQEDVPPMTAQEVQQAFIETYGQPPQELFMGFDPDKPIKSGSIGSIYIAKKPFQVGGEEVLRTVVLKVGRQNLDREFIIGKLVISLAIMSSQYWAPHSKLAPFLEALQEQLSEFVEGFTRELDFEQEARLQQLFYDRSHDSTIWDVPALYRSSRRILEMEFLGDAVSLSHATDRMPVYKRRRFQRQLSRRFLYTILYHLVFYQECHGDLHQGNIMIGPRGQLYLIDWGNAVDMQGKWKQVWDYLLGAALADRELLTDALINMSTDPDETRKRWDEIRDTLGETLDRRGIKPLTAKNMLWVLSREGMQGLHKRAQSVMHLAANTQQLGIVMRGDYMHLSRSLFAAIGSFGSLYEDDSTLTLLRDLALDIGQLPGMLVLDKANVRLRSIRQHLARRVPITIAHHNPHQPVQIPPYL